MNFEIYQDEISVIGKQFEKYHGQRCVLAKKQWKPRPKVYKKWVIISNGTTMEDLLLHGLDRFADTEKILVNAFGTSFVKPSDDTCAYRTISAEELHSEAFEETAVLLLVNSADPDPRWIELFNLCVQKARVGKANALLVATLIPPVRAIPDGIQKLQEREYAFFLEKVVQEHTESERFVIQFEAACRAAMAELGDTKLTCLRFDNLFGSTGVAFPAFDLENMIRNAFAQGKICVTKEDHLTTLSFMYNGNAALSVLAGAIYGKHGHVYNVTNQFLTIAEIKTMLQKLFPDKIALETDGQTYSVNDRRYQALSGLKFLHEQTKLTTHFKNLETALYATACAWMDLPFDVQSRLTCYEGKLQRLKDAEIDILQEIDRICRKHDIQYFLAGGSCLGAIRENKSIPWDDDLDIGMLREDFEKFRKIAPQELSDKYVYSSPDQDPNCHYYFDKIRLSDTYFSTFYSNKFVLDDGVFVDVVVYDQTTNNKLRQRWQIRLLSAMVRLINLRWHGYPTGKGKLKKIARFILPFLNKMPFKWLHKRYDRYATRYMKRKNAEFVLDGGTHLIDGPFRRDSIREVEYVAFDGMEQAPIPTGYHEYLSFLYSENYRPAPPISSRLAAHKIARLDLGKYLFENSPKQTFRAVDIRGELFEVEDER